jgi:hypothetical protein
MKSLIFLFLACGGGGFAVMFIGQGHYFAAGIDIVAALYGLALAIKHAE